MDVVQRELLLRHREALVADVLEPESLLPLLLSHKILNHEDSNLIHAQVTSQARMRQLLDLLPSRGAWAFGALCTALEPNYSWLSELLSSQAEAVASQSQSGDEPFFKEELFLDARLRGGVPLPPPNFVNRTHQIQSVREKLQGLGHRECLVLHGMTGSGKSCLAAAALDSKELVLGTFKGVVLWVSLGDGVLPAQLTLLNKLESHWPLPSPAHPSAHLLVLNTEELAREALVARLLAYPPELRHGLLVLDDVTSHQALLAFDIGCRVLLLTQDLNVLGSLFSRCNIVEMVPGFLEAESLELLASSVGMQPSEVWPQAKEIHQKAWGFPLVISLVGGMLAQFKEDACHSEDRWKQYSDMLSRQHRCRRNSLSRPGLMEAIKQSLDTLTPELQQRYRQLVVFEDDVNILPEVLATLWGERKYEVEESMCVLVRKSLASRRWNEELRCYVYGVHYLLLHYLHATLSEQDIKGSHAQLVHRYEALVGGDWGALPQDNYVHLFLASHVVRAGLGRSLLPDVLLSLGFVAARLRLSLPADLLRDFQRLREILEDEAVDLHLELDHYQKFVEHWGNRLWRHSFLNPVQCALQEPSSSLVHRAAYRLAQSSQDTPFFLTTRVCTVLPGGGVGGTRTQGGTKEVPGDFSSACLCCQHLLLAHQDGSVHMWDPEYNRCLRWFRGLCSPALSLSVSPNHSSFAAASANGEVLLWTLPQGTCTCQGDQAPTPPPRLRQASWQPLHGDALELGPVRLETGVASTSNCCVEFSAGGELLAWCCSDKLKVWRVTRGSAVVVWELDKLQGVTRCSFGLEDSVLFVAAGDVYLCEALTGKVLNCLPTSSPTFLLPLKGAGKSGGWCLELSGQQLRQWEWWSRVLAGSWAPTNQLLMFGGDVISSLYTSVALTANQVLLGVSTEDSQLLLIERSSMKPLHYLPTPPSCPLIALEKISPTLVRALMGGGAGPVTVMDLDMDVAPLAYNHPDPPVWSSAHQWAAHIDQSGNLRVLCGDKVVYVVCGVTHLAGDGPLLVLGTRGGLVATMTPATLIHPPLHTLGRLESAVSHLSCTQGWVVASSAPLQLKVWGPQGESRCIGLAAPVMQAHLMGEQSLLLVCTSYGLQMWDVGWRGEGTSQECLAANIVSAEGHLVLAFAFAPAELIVALSTSRLQIEVCRLELGSCPRLLSLHCLEVPGEAVALALFGDLLAAAVPSEHLLSVWSVREGQMLAEARHDAAVSVGQAYFEGTDCLVTSGAVLAWWQMPQSPDSELKLVQVLQPDRHRGLLSFSPSLDCQDLMVSDGRGLLSLVRPANAANSPTQPPKDPWRPFPEQPTKEIFLPLEEEHTNGHNGVSHNPSLKLVM